MNPIIEKVVNCDQPITFTTTPARLLILIAQLQLALRHPDNTGKSAEISLQFIQNMTKAISTVVPEAQELIEMGNNPAYDISREYAIEFYGDEI